MKTSRPAAFNGHSAQAIALGLALIAVSAMADVVDITWDASGHFERMLSVTPGKFVEVCGKLPAGMKVHWDFDASAPMDFNVHYHAGKDIVFPSKLTNVAMAKDTLDAKLDQHFCWMWSNKSAATTTFTIRLQR